MARVSAKQMVSMPFEAHLCCDDTVDHGAGHHSRADEAELGVGGGGHGADLENKRCSGARKTRLKKKDNM